MITATDLQVLPWSGSRLFCPSGGRMQRTGMPLETVQNGAAKTHGNGAGKDGADLSKQGVVLPAEPRQLPIV